MVNGTTKTLTKEREKSGTGGLNVDDLISRKAVVEYLMTNMVWHDEDGYEVDDADEKRTIIEDLINGIPSSPAVPLDKLCEWLDEQGMLAPCFFTDNACDDCKMGKYWERKKSECWKKWLTKQMEVLE